MEFKNKENECVKTVDGREVWLSRSIATCSSIIIERAGRRHVLMGKRGPGCPDEVGKWVLPCGYLDHDESIAQCAIREVYEETGFDVIGFIRSIEKYSGQIIFENFRSPIWRESPWHMHVSMEGRQNITMHYGVYVKVDDDYTLPDLHCGNSEKDEVADLRWIDIVDLPTYQCGFNHYQRIHTFLSDVINPRLTIRYRIKKQLDRLWTWMTTVK